MSLEWSADAVWGSTRWTDVGVPWVWIPAVGERPELLVAGGRVWDVATQSVRATLEGGYAEVLRWDGSVLHGLGAPRTRYTEHEGAPMLSTWTVDGEVVRDIPLTEYRIQNDDRVVDRPALGDAHFAWSDRDQQVSVFTLQDRELVGTFPAASGYSVTLAFLPAGLLLAFGSKEAFVWDIEAAQLLAHHHFDEYFNTDSVAVAPDGRVATTAGYAELWVWDPVSGRVDWKAPAEGRYVAWSPDGTYVAWAGTQGMIHVARADGEPVGEVPAPAQSPTVLFSPQSDRLCIGGFSLQFASVSPTSVELERDRTHVLSDRVRDLAWGSRLVSLDASETVVGWSADGNKVFEISEATTIAASHDYLVVAHGGAAPRLHTLDDGAQQLHLEGHSGQQMALDPTGRWLASAGFGLGGDRPEFDEDRQLLVWDLHVPGPPAVRDLDGEWLRDVAWSPDANRLAVLGKALHVLRWPEGSVLWSAPAENVEGIAFSPDGRLVARRWREISYVSDDGGMEPIVTDLEGAIESLSIAGPTLAVGHRVGGVSLFDLAGARVATFAEGHERVTRVALSPDGTRLAASGHETQIHLYVGR